MKHLKNSVDGDRRLRHARGETRPHYKLSSLPLPSRHSQEHARQAHDSCARSYHDMLPDPSLRNLTTPTHGPPRSFHSRPSKSRTSAPPPGHKGGRASWNGGASCMGRESRQPCTGRTLPRRSPALAQPYQLKRSFVVIPAIARPLSAVRVGCSWDCGGRPAVVPDSPSGPRSLQGCW